MHDVFPSTSLADLHAKCLERTFLSEDLRSDLSREFHAECNNLRYENALRSPLLEEALRNCTCDLHDSFIRRQSSYADIDVLTLVTDGKIDFCEEHEDYEAFRNLLEISVSQVPLQALQTMTGDEDNYLLRGVLVIRMGPGTYNFAHPHGRQFTANILLQDLPRDAGSAEGMYFVHYYPQNGKPYPNPLREDARVRSHEFQRIIPTRPGAMNARKPNVFHGVTPVLGERELRPSPESCRYTLTYVLEKPRRNSAIKI